MGIFRIINVYILILLGFCFLITSCDYLEPELDDRLSDEQMMNDPAYFEGLLLHAYQSSSGQIVYNFGLDHASDDAVTNNLGSNYRRMAIGEWRADFSPASVWNGSYQELYYINLFLERFEEIEWSYQDEMVDLLHRRRLRGEAYGLRAWYHFRLLQAHAGVGEDGRLLGIPIITRPLGREDDINLPRMTFAESVDHIMTDIDSAIYYLPDRYRNYTVAQLASGVLPEQWPEVNSSEVYNSTMGERFRNRFPGLAAKALKSRLSLLAASPAFGYMTWEEAAIIAGELLAENGGLSALSPTGLLFYQNHLDPDIIWNTSRSPNNSMERDNYPPSQYGRGRTNPSQELVDAFGMANGFPKDHQLSFFDTSRPYANRDPRLRLYVVTNGSVLKDSIYTYVGHPNDGIESLLTSTRTGYYLKKLLLFNQVNLVPGNVTQANRFYTYFRFTEVFLNYAEAANEAWGPDADPMGFGFTATEVIRAIRHRAGLSQPDVFIQFFVTNQDVLRTLIKNERRLELCFEGNRFWDIRRWGDINTMKAPVSGVFIRPGETPAYQYRVVEDRAYRDYMLFGPIPYGELLRNTNLIQNQGW